jgi:hypothetical protein
MHTIYHQLKINAAACTIFKAISDPTHLVHWWPLTCTGSPIENGTYNYFFGEPYDWWALVSKCTINEVIEFKMTKADEEWMPTSFGYIITPQEDGCILKFYHSGWAAQSEHYCIASFCWAMLLNGLKQYIEQGVVIPFEKRN